MAAVSEADPDRLDERRSQRRASQQVQGPRPAVLADELEVTDGRDFDRDRRHGRRPGRHPRQQGEDLLRPLAGLVQVEVGVGQVDVVHGQQVE